MKKIGVIISILFCGLVSAQDFGLKTINLVGGKQFTNLLFKNSDGIKNSDLKYQLNNAFGINFSLEGGRNVFRPEILYRQAGAQSSFQDVKLNWNMSYLNVNLVYLFKVLDSDRFSIATGAGFGTGFLLSGFQEIGDLRYDIVQKKSMKRLDINGLAMLNFTAKVTNFFSIGLEYRFGAGLNQIENDINAQKTHNIYHGVLLNLGFSIINSSSNSKI